MGPVAPRSAGVRAAAGQDRPSGSRGHSQPCPAFPPEPGPGWRRRDPGIDPLSPGLSKPPLQTVLLKTAIPLWGQTAPAGPRLQRARQQTPILFAHPKHFPSGTPFNQSLRVWAQGGVRTARPLLKAAPAHSRLSPGLTPGPCSAPSTLGVTSTRHFLQTFSSQMCYLAASAPGPW